MAKMIIFICITAISFQSNDDIWFVNFDQAVKKADKEKKHLMLYFSGSDWCRPCILLKKKVFETDDFKSFAEKKLVLVKFDFPARKENSLAPDQVKHNEKMAEIYNPDGNFPHIVLVTPAGDKIIELASYNNQPAKEYIAKLQRAIIKE